MVTEALRPYRDGAPAKASDWIYTSGYPPLRQ